MSTISEEELQRMESKHVSVDMARLIRAYRDLRKLVPHKHVGILEVSCDICDGLIDDPIHRDLAQELKESEKREKDLQASVNTWKRAADIWASEARAAQMSDQGSIEVGWLIEKIVNNRPHWLTCAWSFGWTDKADTAIRFCRRVDAEQIASMMENEPIAIMEHSWS